MDADMIRQLARPQSFPHAVEDIRLLETHISWIILTGPFAYKIKKPVSFGFLDFSTLEKREHCCREEVRLNNRTSTGLYLDVVAVRESAQGLQLGGDGKIVDYAVKMTQFDPCATLADLLENGTVSAASFDRLGYRIGRFHVKAARAGAESPWGDLAAVIDPVEENFRQLRERIGPEELPRLAALEKAAMEELERLKPVITARKQAGFVRELHGDLHAGNIVEMGEEWVAFDCIEFNPNLRWIDMVCDLGFLTMDLALRGFPHYANRFLNAWLEYTGDYEGLRLLDFYQSYRAMVRAKVAILRRVQEEDITAKNALLASYHAYLDYCVALEKKKTPFLAMTMGVSGSGKSTIAKDIAAQYGAIYVRSDAVRKRQFGLLPDESSPPAERGKIYSTAASAQVFAEMLALAELLLSLSLSVIVDATFIQKRTRTPFLALAKKQGVPWVILSCTASPVELENRIRQREQAGNDPSEAGVQIMRQQMDHVEAPDQEEAVGVVAVNAPNWQTLLQQKLGRTE